MSSVPGKSSFLCAIGATDSPRLSTSRLSTYMAFYARCPDPPPGAPAGGSPGLPFNRSLRKGPPSWYRQRCGRVGHLKNEWPTAAWAQASPDPHAAAPQAQAVRASGPIHLDGRLDEPAWRAATPITAFTQLDPREGQPVSEPTEVRVLYDDAAVYLGVRLDGPVRYRLGRRDMDLLDSDWFGVAFDGYHDHRTAFRFQVNPGGVQRDATIRMEGGQAREDDSWDGVWDVATSRDSAGWTAELRIPFSQLRFRTNAEEVWGFQLERIIGSQQEYAEWSFTPKREFSGVPRYGHLAGLQGVRPGKRLEVLPYVVGRGEYVDPGPDPFRSDAEHSATTGADVLYRLASDFTLNGTINPDFGQVEVDPAIVNLGVYETFFPEKRPFFVEGSEIFNFSGNTSGGSLFYSRRIGRSPQLRPATAASDVPAVTTIPAAVKVSGKTAGGWSVGLLEAVTARENAQYVDAGGLTNSLAVEPLTNDFVGRARHEANAGRSWFGGIVTAVDRDLATPNLSAALRSAAYAAGVDWRHEWAGRSWAFQGSMVGSLVQGSPQALIATQRQSNHYFQRPDAPYLGVDSSATSLQGYSVGASLAKQAGEHWRGDIAGALTAPAFEVNDLGFQTRTDRRDRQADLIYLENRPGRFLREYDIGLSWRDESNYGGDRIQEFFVLSGGFTHLNFSRLTWFARHRLRSWDDRSTRGGPMIIRPAESEGSISVRSDTRKPLLLRANASRTHDEYGGGSWDFGVDLAVRTSPRWNLSVGPAVSTGRIAAQYVGTVSDSTASATYGKRYRFAPLDFTQVDAEIRLNIAVTPRLNLQSYVQPLIFSSDYGQVGSLVAPRTFDVQPDTAAGPSLDGTFRSLRGNMVLTWEWRPGSRLYVAWQHWRQGVVDAPAFDFGRDVPGLFDARANNILVIKVSDWLNF